MAEQAIFKSQTFGGFNKEEVLKYIDNLNAGFSDEQEKLNGEISSLSSELSEKRDKLDEIEKKYDEIMTAYEELRQHYLMLKEHSDNIEADNEKLAARLEKSEKELAIEKELTSQLEDRLEAEAKKSEARAAKEKNLLHAIDEANGSAKLMLAGAKAGAQAMLADAQDTADGINSEIEEFGEELEKTKAFMEDSLSVLIQRLEYIGRMAEGAKLSSDERTRKNDDIQKKFDRLVSENDEKTAALKERFFR